MHEATVRNFKKAFFEELQGSKAPDDKLSWNIIEACSLSPKMEQVIIDYIRKQTEWSCGESMILVSAARRIVEYMNKGILKEFGETAELTRVWAH